MNRKYRIRNAEYGVKQPPAFDPKVAKPPAIPPSVFRTPHLLLLLLLFAGCGPDRPDEPDEHRQATAVVQSWNRLLLDLERYTPGYRAPVSARMLGYVAVAAYEASLPGLPGYVSLEQYLLNYPRPDAGWKAGEAFCLPASVNAAYAQISRRFFSTAPADLLGEIDRLEARWKKSCTAHTDGPGDHSAAFGRSVAEAIWQWSATDSLGHEAYLYNFDRAYTPPSGPGCWHPSSEHPMPALLPQWGNVRPFIVTPAEVGCKPPAAYAEAPGSAFYTEAVEVVTVSNPLSQENRWVAEFWADDLPGLTISPAGRWISIAGQVIEKKEPPFPVVLETYLKLGLALSDVGVACWEAKYRYNVERPETYIRRVIRPGWTPLHDAPSFPSYPSGHSAFGAVSSAVLQAVLGDSGTFTDHTHDGRPEFEGEPRTFHSFQEMSRENAFSRVALGVHFRMDCTEGLRIGTLIGQRVAKLKLRSSEAGL